MSKFRSYFLKNNCLINTNLTNNSQNPVGEISYGTVDERITRLILDIDLSELLSKTTNGLINPNRITSHILHMTNTINSAQQYIGKKSYSSSIERASGFVLDLFNINEDWDEGTGYDFIYDDLLVPNATKQPSNWMYRKVETPWSVEGAYSPNSKMESMSFVKGSENINIDVTDYINQRLFGTGYTGTSAYTGSTYGLGVKFSETYEAIQTDLIQAVAFHCKNTNTWFEPYIETTIDDVVIDDRNFFYLDKENDLYLFSDTAGRSNDVIVNSVDIYDYENNLLTTITGTSIIKVSKGVFKVTLTLSSAIYPDAVLFRDVWNLKLNGRSVTHNDDFYLISNSMYNTFNQSNVININNYHFNFTGISEREHMSAGSIKKIKIKVSEFYSNQNGSIPLDLEYRVFTTIGDKYEIDVIPFTAVNRVGGDYVFNLDTSWLIPQDYKIQIRLCNGNYYENKQTLSFTIVSNKMLG